MIEIKEKRVISKPIDEVWKVINNSFLEGHLWARGVVSCRKGNASEGNADRVSYTESGKLMDKITKLDHENYRLQFVVLGLPFFVKSVLATWELREVSSSQTEITIGPKIEVMPVIGTVLQIPMKMQLKKIYPRILEDFAIYVETGKASPAKQKELDKS